MIFISWFCTVDEY